VAACPAADPKILCPDIRAQILPLRVLRIGWRLERVGADVTEAAGHNDTIRVHPDLAIIISGELVVSNRVPLLGPRLVEIRIRKESQADNARSIAVERSDRHILSARADFSSRILLLIFEGIRRAIRPGYAFVEPQTIALRVRSGRF